MKPQHRRLSFIVLILAVNLACTGLGTPPTATEKPTNTPLPTKTATPKPTSTPKPTATQIPPTFTTVPMQFPASNEQYEVKVLYARFFAKVFSGGFEYTPLIYKGKFLDLGVVVKNLQPDNQANIPWENVYIIDKLNGAYYPNFGGSFVSKNNEKFDPATLFLFPQEGLENMVFDDLVYLRGIWATDGQKPATFLFGFDTSPLIEIIIE